MARGEDFGMCHCRLARTGIVAGVALALMETLADFGTVSYFAVNTFTAGIYRAWLSLGDSVAAGQLATCLLVFVLAMLALERMHRGGARLYRQPHTHHPQFLRGAKALGAFTLCATPVAFGFVVPAAILLELALTDPQVQFGTRITGLITNTFILAGVAAMAAVIVAMLLAYAARTEKSPLVRAANRLAVLGYALPGAVIAVGILLPLGKLDNASTCLDSRAVWRRTGLILTGSVTALIYAYLVRFLAVAFQTVEAGLTRVTFRWTTPRAASACRRGARWRGCTCRSCAAACHCGLTGIRRRNERIAGDLCHAAI